MAAGIVVCLAALIAAVVRMSPVVGGYHDDAIYVANAKSLAEGRGYRSINLPGAPHQTKYPPLYPAVLALVWKVWPSFPSNAIALKCVSIFAAGGAALMMTLYLVRWGYASPGLAAAAGLLTWTSPFTAYFSSQTLSEMPFALVLALALWSGERALNGVRDLRHMLLVGCLAGLPTLVRALGIALGLAVVARVGFVGRRAMVGVLAGVSLVAGSWFAWSSRVADSSGPVAIYYGDYLSWWLATISNTGQTVLVNGFLLVRSLAFFGFDPLADYFGVLALLLPAGAIVWHLARNVFQGRVLGIFIGCYLAIVLVWPWPPARFIVPVAHPLLFMAMHPLWFHRWKQVRYTVCVCLGVGVVYNVQSMRLHASLVADDGYVYFVEPALGERLKWSEYEALFSWIRENTPPRAVLASGMDSMLYLYTGRPGVRPFTQNVAAAIYTGEEPTVAESRELMAAVKAHGATYIVVCPMPGFLEESSYVSVVAKLRLTDALQVVYAGTDPRFQVLYVHQEEADLTTGQTATCGLDWSGATVRTPGGVETLCRTATDMRQR